MRFGLLGRKLTHSYSPKLHSMLADYEYKLYEKEENEVADFLMNLELDGLNVTIPYKKTVIPYLNEISPAALSAGSVNTVVKRPDGTLYGDNTDIYGFVEMVRYSGIDVSGKKALVLGSGGASVAAIAGLKQLNATPVIISRSGEYNYNNLELNADAQIIVNTTPVGMYPNVSEAPLDLKQFPALEGVIDIIYNPACTELTMQAEELGIPNITGLYMLVAQAKRACELFTGRTIPDSETDRIYKDLFASMQNIVLIGMPGVGKTTIAEALKAKLERPVIDSDYEIESRTGAAPRDIIVSRGEDAFRAIESEVLNSIAAGSGQIISVGGGAITREVNYKALHRNSKIVWLKRDITQLATNGRPLSQSIGLEELYRQREPLYKRFADVTVDIGSDVVASLEAVMKALQS